MVSTALLLVTVFINGQQLPSQLTLSVMSSDCRTEMSIIEGVNRTQEASGIRYQAQCVRTNG